MFEKLLICRTFNKYKEDDVYEIEIRDSNSEYDTSFSLLEPLKNSNNKIFTSIMINNYKCYGIDICINILPYLLCIRENYSGVFNEFIEEFPEYKKQILRYQLLL
jgi:hypothetical protein